MEDQQSLGMLDAANDSSSEEASGSDQLPGAADGKSLEERRAVDRANHAADAKRSRYFTRLMKTVADAHTCEVSLAVVAISNRQPNANIKKAVVGLAATQQTKVMPHLAKIRKIMAKTVRACVMGIAEQASEAALQPRKQRNGRKNGASRMLLEHGEGQAAEQPSPAADDANDAELLRGSQAAGTASGTEMAAGDAARPVQQGQPHHPAVAARTHCRHSCTLILPCCQCCPERTVLNPFAYRCCMSPTAAAATAGQANGLTGMTGAHGAGPLSTASGRGRGNAATPGREPPQLPCPDHGLEVISLVNR